MTWAATQAKAKFSEVLDRAETSGPQLVKRRKREFLVITKEDFAERAATKVAEAPVAIEAPKAFVSAWDALGSPDMELIDVEFPRERRDKSAPEKPQNLAEFFKNSPLVDSGIDLERVKLSPRHVDF